MNKLYYSSYTILIACTLLLSCANKKKAQEDKNTLPVKPSKDVMADVNRYLSEKDKAVIEGYDRRNKLNLTLSEEGFYYTIFEAGNGEKINNTSIVSIVGTLNLIDGTLCYTYTTEEPKVIAISKSPEITGLHLALPMLSENGHALFVFPPNLAFGLLGDDDKVPPRSTIVMDVKVVIIKE